MLLYSRFPICGFFSRCGFSMIIRHDYSSINYVHFVHQTPALKLCMDVLCSIFIMPSSTPVTLLSLEDLDCWWNQ